MIRAESLVKQFENKTALDTLDTEIADGSIYGLIGSNGSGKSTFLRLIAGVYRPDGGRVMIDGADIFENIPVKQQIFFVSDEFFYFPQQTMDDMAQFFACSYDGWSWEIYEQISKHFPIPRDRKIRTFSKGMKRQASVILGIAAQPRYLLLDEAFDGLDPVIRMLLRKVLADSVAKTNATVIITSHNLRELEDMCDNVGLLHDGRILFQREIDDIKLGFCKVQAAFRPMPEPDELKNSLQILQMTQRGSLLSLVARGAREEIVERLEGMNPLFVEAIPLTLEEVFIHEMEAVGYDYNNIIF